MSNNYLKHLGVIFITTILGLLYIAWLRGYSSMYIAFSLLRGRDFIFSAGFATIIWFVLFRGLIK